MRYIVWKNFFINGYKIPQGDGYYVGWKDKLSDKYSKNWIDAKKYVSFQAAMVQLGFKFPRIQLGTDYVDRNGIDLLFKSFLEKNLSTESKRNILLNDLLSINNNDILEFSVGRIDKINDKGEIVGTAYNELLNTLRTNFESIIDNHNKKIKKIKDSYVETEKVDVSTEDYCDDFMKFFEK